MIPRWRGLAAGQAVAWSIVAGAAVALPAPAGEGPDPQRVTLEIRERDRPLPCRVHLRDPAGQPVRPGAGAPLPFWRDHFVCPGSAALELPPGRYEYEIERGPEYRAAAGAFDVPLAGDPVVRVSLERLADMAAEGWWSGDLHVHRPVSDIELLMRAEDLHVAPVITWWNNQNLWADKELPADPLVRFDDNRAYQRMGGEDEREGGALLFFHLVRPVAISGSSREYPPPLRFVEAVRRQPGAWVDIEKPFWWDVPAWLASGKVDSIGLANNHMCRSQMYETEAWGRPRDAARLPAPLGNGFWSQEIYYQVLNAGLRVPPSAGSASGVLPNPVGYNRVYVQLPDRFRWEDWWEGLRAGRSFVTNGPLLRVNAAALPAAAEGTRPASMLPGHVFRSPDGKPLRVSLAGWVGGRDPIRSIEVIQDGKVERRVDPAALARSGDFGTLDFTASGWFLVRVLADNSKTFRFASTAPFYVEIGAQPRTMRRSAVRFFQEWVRERTGRIKLDDPAQQEEVLRYHREAAAFWQRQLDRANAD